MPPVRIFRHISDEILLPHLLYPVKELFRILPINHAQKQHPNVLPFNKVFLYNHARPLNPIFSWTQVPDTNNCNKNAFLLLLEDPLYPTFKSALQPPQKNPAPYHSLKPPRRRVKMRRPAQRQLQVLLNLM